ncbi:addiction module protein [Pyxidicoccus sp. 3LG]
MTEGASRHASRLLAAGVTSEALELPDSECVRVAAGLLASVDGEPEPDAEAALAAEIERRVQRVEVEAGGVRLRAARTSPVSRLRPG